MFQKEKRVSVSRNGHPPAMEGREYKINGAVRAEIFMEG